MKFKKPEKKNDDNKEPEKNNDDNEKPEKNNDDSNERICGPGQLPYEAFNVRYPDACAVYCVPNSHCEGKIQHGKMKQYNITHRGSCKEKGFTEPAELTSFGQNIIKSLQRIDGACKGMTMMKFKKPENIC